MNLEAKEAAEELLRRRRIRNGLLPWCIHALKPFDQEPVAHHKLLIKKLEEVAAGKINRLMINLPPGAAKSTYGSQLFPAWFFAQKPNMDIIGASNTASLAEGFSRRTMGFIRDNFAELGYGLKRESVDDWETTNGGRYRAVGVGGAIAGRRADCLVSGTLVETNNGPIPIENIEVGMATCYALSYDEQKSRHCFSPIIAKRRSYTESIWRIHTQSGIVVECTANHRFFTRKGWREASSLGVGDVLLRAMRKGKPQSASGYAKNDRSKTQNVLWSGLHEFSEANSPMPSMWEGYGWSRSHENFVFGSMSESFGCGQRIFVQNDHGKDLRGLSKEFCSSEQCNSWPILFKRLQEHWTQNEYIRREESGLARRDERTTWIDSRLAFDKTSDLAEGQYALCDMPRNVSVGGSSYRFESSEQFCGESGYFVQESPSETPCCGAWETECDSVSRIERVCKECIVYDVQIAGTKCFFANGILVHNCAIIDDPTRSRADAESEDIREKQWNWFISDLRTRLKPNAAIVIIMTRWHIDDLGGRVLERQKGLWEVISLPAFAGQNDPLGRLPGETLWNDPKYPYGEELRKIHDEYMEAGAERDWAALYQQEPTLLEGNIFKVGKINVFEAMPVGCTMVRAWDLAGTVAKAGTNPDWTVGFLLGKTREGGYLISDLVRFRGGPDEVEATIKATATRDGRQVPISLPTDPGQAGVAQIQYLTRKLAGYNVHSSRETGDKGTRAMPFASQVNVGNVGIVRGDWNRFIFNEFASFPSGMHDDCVDAGSRAFTYLAGSGSALERARRLI